MPRTGFTRANITPSIVFPIPAPHQTQELDYTMRNQRPMTEAEAIIADHHRANNELPAAFHTFVVTDESNDTSAEPQHIMDPSDIKGMLTRPNESTHSAKKSTPSTFTLTVSIGRTGEHRNSRASFCSTVPSPLSASFTAKDTSGPPPAMMKEDKTSDPTQRYPTPTSFSSFVFPERFPEDKSPASRPGTGNSTTSQAKTFGTADRSSFMFPAARLAGNRTSIASVASSRSAIVFAKNALSAMHKKALQAFEPLLPDEIPVNVGDTLSLLQTFDDGWCVCAVEVDSEGGNGSGLAPPRAPATKEVKMGCAPLWVFERKSKNPGDHMRSMRSTSLAVTIELTPNGAGMEPAGRVAAPWQRDPVISWSNF